MNQYARSSTMEDLVDPTCSPWGCGTNSATVGDGVVFDELDGSGTADIRGVKIMSAKLDPSRRERPVKLRAYRHTISAIDILTGASYEGTALVGTIITLAATLPSGATARYELTIEAVSPDQKNRPVLRFWAGDPDPIPSYLITSRRVDSGCKPVPICKVHLPPGEPIPSELIHDAIVFEGDRYDASAKTVTDVDPDMAPFNTHFNLACAGTAPAKMHLMRHTRAGAWTASEEAGSDGDPPYDTTREQRQAMLKMFTADDCGTGTSFTVDGQPLRYGDASHWYPGTPALRHDGSVSPAVGTLEAVWDEHGAMCLDVPRDALAIPTDSPSPTARVSRPKVEQECSGRTDLPSPSDPLSPHALPPCTGAGGLLSSGGSPPAWHVISAVPPRTP